MYAVIMAGGGGTRLWPLSRGARPKPFLPLLEGGRCLLEQTVSHLDPLISHDDVYVVTDSRYADMVRRVAPDIPPANIIGEPMGRNTAAAVALAAHAIDRPDDEVMLVLPADQAIRDADGFRAALAAAEARAKGGEMITLGVEPTRPDTGYGYVIAASTDEEHGGRATFRVERFEEKPTPERAEALIASGRAYWNAGIFAWQRASVVRGLAHYAADISAPIAAWVAGQASRATATRAGWPGTAMGAVYEGLRATSIDYALLEPASIDGHVAVVPMSVGWSDLGSWSALRDHRRGSDEAPVISAEAPAQVIDVDSSNVLVQAMGGRTIALVGLKDIIVVDTPDALLVMAADAAQDVKRVVDQLKAEGREELL